MFVGVGEPNKPFYDHAVIMLSSSHCATSNRGEGSEVYVRVSVLPTHVMTYTNICSNNPPMATTKTDKRDTAIKSYKNFDNKSKCEPKARRVEVSQKRPSSSECCCSIWATLMHLLSTQKDKDASVWVSCYLTCH